MVTCYRAVAYSGYGGPDVLRLVERDVPRPGPGQVRIAVRAAGVNPIDWKIRSGQMAAMMPVEFPVVPGGDVAGMVDEVGAGVTAFAAGDEVFGAIGSGAYAQQALAPVDGLAAKPPEVPWEVAAALPIAGNTTYHVFEELNVAPGETIVIDGAAGGVGTVAVQVAKHRGLTVIGTASERNHDYLRSLGAIPVTYGEGVADRIRAAAPQGVHAALDASGRGSLSALIEVTGGTDRVVTIADPSAAQRGVRFVAAGRASRQRLEEAAALAAAGRLTIPIAATYTLEQAADAHRASEAGHVRGKLIIVPH